MNESGLIWFVHERNNEDAKINLLCFPYAGGSSTYFAPLKSKIDPKINIYPILLPEREKNAKIKNSYSVKELAHLFVKENEKLFAKEVAILGHCTGALLGYEVALEAKRQYGVTIKKFYASSSPAPSGQQFWSQKMSDDDMVAQMIQNKMIDETFAKNTAFQMYYLPLIKSDLKLFFDYEPQMPYEKMDTSVTVLHGDDDYLFDDPSSSLDWGNFSNELVEEKIYSGGHFYIDQHRDEVGSFITEQLL